mgnify:CR=1 FL=1
MATGCMVWLVLQESFCCVQIPVLLLMSRGAWLGHQQQASSTAKTHDAIRARNTNTQIDTAV